MRRLYEFAGAPNNRLQRTALRVAAEVSFKDKASKIVVEKGQIAKVNKDAKGIVSRSLELTSVFHECHPGRRKLARSRWWTFSAMTR